MAAHILQVAYYPNLQETRALMLKSAGRFAVQPVGDVPRGERVNLLGRSYGLAGRGGQYSEILDLLLMK